jgi:hypothetical protein
MSHLSRSRARGSTRVELAVAIGAVATVLAIVCPVLSHARVRAGSAVCEGNLRNFGIGMLVYANENLGFIPGVNTSGVSTRAKVGMDAMNARTVPVQSFDWMTPIIQDDPALPDRWIERFNYLYNDYRCPLQTRTGILYTGGGLSSEDMEWAQSHAWLACSYLMPAYFSYWGQAHVNEVLAYYEANPALAIRASVPPTSWEVRNTDYNSHLEQVGPAARKIFAADGTRYVHSSAPGAVPYAEIDLSPTPTYFGAFSDGGGWWSGSTAYGVKIGTKNWDGYTLGTGSPSRGANLEFSYRHPGPPSIAPTAKMPGHYQSAHLPGVGDGDLHASPTSGAAQDNHGCINVVCFDGHTEHLTDRGSRDIDRWYPTGSVVSSYVSPIEEMTVVPSGYVIP